MNAASGASQLASATPQPYEDGSGATGLLRVYTLAGDRVAGRSFAAAILVAAGDAHLRGATVLPAVAGFGRHGYEPQLSVEVFDPERQPLIVEIVDGHDALLAFLPALMELNHARRMVMLERVRVYDPGAA